MGASYQFRAIAIRVEPARAVCALQVAFLKTRASRASRAQVCKAIVSESPKQGAFMFSGAEKKAGIIVPAGVFQSCFAVGPRLVVLDQQSLCLTDFHGRHRQVSDGYAHQPVSRNFSCLLDWVLAWAARALKPFPSQMRKTHVMMDALCFLELSQGGAAEFSSPAISSFGFSGFRRVASISVAAARTTHMLPIGKGKRKGRQRDGERDTDRALRNGTRSLAPKAAHVCISESGLE